jgi:hypothetical protein
MAHNRKLVLGAVALTAARNNQHDIEVMGTIMDEIEPVMASTGYLDNAPFKWVGLILRYGLKNDDKPSYQRINKKHGDLPVAIELDTHELRHASRDELKELFVIATLKVLVDVAKQYALPHERFEKMLRDMRANNASSSPSDRPSAT